MKSNIVIFTLLSIYFVIMAVIYNVACYAVYGELEWAGAVAIPLCAGLTGLYAFYLWLNNRKQGGVLVEDREDADIADGDPEIGEFSPWSWWPLVLAFACGVAIVGVCIGNMFWLAIFGLPLVLVAVVGWVFEYYRGNFAR